MTELNSIYKRLPNDKDWIGNDINSGNFTSNNVLDCAKRCQYLYPEYAMITVWWPLTSTHPRQCYCKSGRGNTYDASGNQAYRIY